MDICNCDIDLEAFLCNIPSEWREGVVKSLCYVYNNECEEILCKGVKDCETTTFLSPFSINTDDEISIRYNSEKTQVERMFNILPLINNTLNNINPSCLATDEEWANMTFVERIQLFTEVYCECCTTTTTTTTSTTTIAPTTTTTTTIPATTTTTTTTIPTTTTTSTTITTTTAPEFMWVADEQACETEGGFGIVKTITGLSSPFKAWYDESTNRQLLQQKLM